MRAAALALWTLALACRAWGGAIAYSRFAHPEGQYALEYPSDWKTSFGIQTLMLRPSGRAGELVRINLELHPLGRGSPKTAEAFVGNLASQAGKIKSLDARETVKVSGRKAERLALTETVELKDRYGAKLPGPMREVYLVVPVEDWYYVLSLRGIGSAFEKALPEFERIAKKLEVNPPAPSKTKYR